MKSRLPTTLTKQPQPPNINQLNQQLITKHNEEITNLTNIIEEKDTIMDQLIDYRIEHKQQPTAQPHQKNKRILLMGDSNATTINQHLHNKPLSDEDFHYDKGDNDKGDNSGADDVAEQAPEHLQDNGATANGDVRSVL